MPSVGTAYVNIRVNTKGFEAGLDKMMARLSTKMEAQGAKLGKDFERGLKKTNFDSAFDGLTKASGKATDQVANDINKITTESREAKDALGDLSGELRDAAASSKRINLGGVGGGSGGLRKAGGDAGFLSNKLNELISEAPRGTAILNGLFQTAAFGGTAIAGLAGGLSATAQGIFAVGANAASAAPALSVFASGLSMVAQLGAAVGIGMQGVGDAIGAGLDSAQKSAVATGGSVAGMGTAVTAASHAVRDAKDALADAYRDAARAAEDAARRTMDAERAYAAAVVRSTIAQKALNAARKEGLEQLEDIAFAAEDAGMAEERASLALQDAHAAMVAASGLAPDDRMRVEAELAYREAELNMRMATDAREDADKEQRAAAKKGVEGTDAMKDARGDLADAHSDEADALRDLKDARRDEAQVAVDNAERIADAQQAIADAQQRVSTAQKVGTAQLTAANTAIDKYAQALKDLSPQQRIFVERILALRGAWIKARKEIADPMFKGFNEALEILIGPNGSLGILKDGLIDTSGVLGDFAVKAADLTTDPLFKDALAGTMESNNTAMETFGDTTLNLADAFIQVADAAGPVLEDFATWTEEVTASWKATARADNKTGKLDETIQSAATTVGEWWGLIKQVGRTMRIFGSDANAAVNGFNDDKGYIPTLTENLKAFNDSLGGQGSQKSQERIEKFDQALRNMSAAGRAVNNAVIKPLLSLGSDPDLEKAFQTIADSDGFQRLADTAGDAVPELADLVVNLADFLADMSESGAIDNFLDILVQVSDVLSTISGFFARSGILKWTGYVTGAYAALKLLWGVGKIGASPFVNLSRGYKTFMGNVKTAKASGKGMFGSIFGSIGKGAPGGLTAAGAKVDDETWEAQVLVQLNLIKVAVDTCCLKMTAAMGRAAAADAGGDLLGSAPMMGGAGKGAGAAAGIGMAAGEVGKVGKFAGVLGKMSKFVGPLSKLMKPLAVGVRVLGAAFRFALGPIGMIVLTLLPILWPLLVKLNEKFGILDKVMAGLQWTLDKTVEGFQWLWEKIKDLFGWIKKNWPYLVGALFGPFGIAVALILKHWDKVMEFVKGVPAKIKKFLKGVWSVFVEGLRTAWGKVKEIWTRVTAWVKGRPDQFKKNLKALWNIFKDGLNTVWTAVKNKWADIKEAIAKWPGQMGTKLAGLWSKFKSLLDDAWTNVTTKWSNIKEAIGKWPEQVKNKLSGLWDGMTDGLKTSLGWVGKKLNGLISGLNKVVKKFGGDGIDFTFPEKFAAGGPVRGPGGPKSDSIAARLSNGEHVWTAAEVRAMGGHQNVLALRKAALKGDTGGLWGSLKDKYTDVKGAIAKGASAAIKWVIGNFTSKLPDNFIGQLINGVLTKSAAKFSGWGDKKDEEAAAKAAAAAGPGKPYTGPPGGWTYPVSRWVPISQWPNSGHSPPNSMDFDGQTGDSIRASSRGIVAAVNHWGYSYGNHVIINHAGGVSTIYAHLASTAVKAGQKVSTGQFLGMMGTTGNSTGVHMHFEVRGNGATDAWLRSHGVRLAKGGVVAPSTGGTMAMLAEAGHHERVTPLDSEGFTPAERRMLEALESSLGGGKGDTYNVHPAPGMNESALADMVARRMAWKRRKGAGRR